MADEGNEEARESRAAVHDFGEFTEGDFEERDENGSPLLLAAAVDIGIALQEEEEAEADSEDDSENSLEAEGENEEEEGVPRETWWVLSPQSSFSPAVVT